MTIWDVLRLRPLLEKVCYVNPLFRLRAAVLRTPSLRLQGTLATEELTAMEHLHQLRCHKTAAGFSTSPLSLSGQKTEENRFLRPATGMANLKVWVDRYLQFLSVATLAEGGAISVASRQAEMVRMALSGGPNRATHQSPAQQRKASVTCATSSPLIINSSATPSVTHASPAQPGVVGTDRTGKSEKNLESVVPVDIDKDIGKLEEESKTGRAPKDLEQANPTAAIRRASSIRQTKRRVTELRRAAVELRCGSPDTADDVGLSSNCHPEMNSYGGAIRDA